MPRSGSGRRSEVELSELEDDRFQQWIPKSRFVLFPNGDKRVKRKLPTSTPNRHEAARISEETIRLSPIATDAPETRPNGWTFFSSRNSSVANNQSEVNDKPPDDLPERWDWKRHLYQQNFAALVSRHVQSARKELEDLFDVYHECMEDALLSDDYSDEDDDRECANTYDYSILRKRNEFKKLRLKSKKSLQVEPYPNVKKGSREPRANGAQALSKKIRTKSRKSTEKKRKTNNQDEPETSSARNGLQDEEHLDTANSRTKSFREPTLSTSKKGKETNAQEIRTSFARNELQEVEHVHTTKSKTKSFREPILSTSKKGKETHAEEINTSCAISELQEVEHLNITKSRTISFREPILSTSKKDKENTTQEINTSFSRNKLQDEQHLNSTKSRTKSFREPILSNLKKGKENTAQEMNASFSRNELQEEEHLNSKRSKSKKRKETNGEEINTSLAINELHDKEHLHTTKSRSKSFREPILSTSKKGKETNAQEINTSFTRNDLEDEEHLHSTSSRSIKRKETNAEEINTSFARNELQEEEHLNSERSKSKKRKETNGEEINTSLARNELHDKEHLNTTKSRSKSFREPILSTLKKGKETNAQEINTSFAINELQEEEHLHLTRSRSKKHKETNAEEINTSFARNELQDEEHLNTTKSRSKSFREPILSTSKTCTETNAHGINVSLTINELQEEPDLNLTKKKSRCRQLSKSSEESDTGITHIDEPIPKPTNSPKKSETRKGRREQKKLKNDEIQVQNSSKPFDNNNSRSGTNEQFVNEVVADPNEIVAEDIAPQPDDNSVRDATAKKTARPKRIRAQISSAINDEEPGTSAEIGLRRSKRQRVRCREIEYIYIIEDKKKGGKRTKAAKSSKSKGRKKPDKVTRALTIPEENHQVDLQAECQESHQLEHEERLINSDNQLAENNNGVNSHQSMSHIIENNLNELENENSFYYDSETSRFKVLYFLETPALKCGYLIIKPGGCKPEAMLKNNIAVFLVLSGKGTMQLNGDACQLVEHSHIAVKEGVLYSIENKSKRQELQIYFYLVGKSNA